LSRRRSLVRLLLPATALAGLLLASSSAGAPARERGDERPERSDLGRPFFDVRASAAQVPARASAAQETLRRSLGVQGVVDIDPLTGTPRVVARLDGFLTGPTARDPRDVVLDYVREHPGVFKLDEGDLAGLRVVRDYTDVAGIRHLHWAQTARGIPAFDNDLRASVTADGRLINVLGSPLPDLAERAAGLAPALDATGGVRAALRSVGRDLRSPHPVARGRGPKRVTRFAGGHRAGLVFFHRGGELAQGWDVTAYADADEVYSTIVDAVSGEVLRRANKVEAATGLAWDYFPSTGAGGDATSRNLDSWLEDPTDTSRLFGPNAHVFSDLNDNNQVDGAGERITAAGGSWGHVFTKIDPVPAAQARCDTEGFTSACSWDSATAFSWQTNRRQNGTQVFYFVNNFHDHLEGDPDIAFDDDSGNFEGDDRVIANTSDRANLGGGFLGDNLPDDAHLNNANMLTPPDGQSPRMQMYLFTWLETGDPTADANGGDDASIVYHEYAHGLSNRLIKYSNGWGALDAHQSGKMGEAWSDW
jgi:extracellular elastinolytic metalloproteinase